MARSHLKNTKKNVYHKTTNPIVLPLTKNNEENSIQRIKKKNKYFQQTGRILAS